MRRQNTLKIPKLKAKICKNYALGKKTWLGVGGPAAYIEPENKADLKLIFENKGSFPITILGGSNVLIRDGGVDGIVVHLGKAFKNYKVIKNTVKCEAGMPLMELAKIAAQHGLSGFEFMSGIPGSLGGALKMNAGAYGSDMSQIVTSITVMDTEGKVHKIDPKKKSFFSYRHSELPLGWIFVEATLKGTPADPKVILKTMEELKQKRIQTQPQKVRTAGSTFKNVPDMPAWKLIDAAGLRGYRYKGAKMSEKHSNFMINEGQASAAALEELGEHVRTLVAQKTGYTLEWEIERLVKGDQMKKIEKVAVIMGGWSGEREVSLASGKGVADALRRCGYTVKEIDLTEDMIAFVRALQAFKPDVIFNALHGVFGEDGCVQGLLDFMCIPYTHSGAEAALLGMDKEKTREIAQKVGVPVANGGLKTKEDMRKEKPALPYVAKPNADGSSLGVEIVRTQKEHETLLQHWGENEIKLVEEYIPGRELTAAVLNGRCLGVLEIVPKTGFYDFKNKYTEGKTLHIVPAPIPPAQLRLVSEYAEKMHKALGCRGVTRSDFRYDDTDKAHPRIIFLEINTNPGMTPFSLVPDIAKHEKITYDMLVDELVKEAQCD